MLGAVVFGHQQQQAVDRARSTSWSRKAASRCGTGRPPAKDEALIDQGRRARRSRRCARRTQLRSKQARQQRLKEIAAKVDAECPAGRRVRRRQAITSATSCSSSKRRSCAARSSTASRASTGATRAPCARSSIRTGVLPRTHGSALFTRGETQALVVATLGTARDEQIIDALMGEYRDRFMFHYNMPPYATGETGRVGIAQAPRDRPRPARQARAARRAADRRGVRVLDARRLRDHRVERQLVDGVGVRRRASR